MKQAKSLLLFCLFAAFPYVLLVGSLTVLFDGNARTFWRSLVTILAIRLLFALLDTAGVFLWRKLCARRSHPRIPCNEEQFVALGLRVWRSNPWGGLATLVHKHKKRGNLQN